MNRTARTALVTAAVAGGTGVLLLATPVFAGGPARGAGDGTRPTSSTACPMWDGDETDGARGDGTRGGGMMRGGTSGRWSDGPARGGTAGRPGGGMMGGGAAGGGMMGDPAANLPAQGTLTDAQKTALAGMAEEEKLAHDVYVALGDATGDRRFAMIATSEARHLDAVRVLLTRYGVTDPTAGRSAGAFASADVTSLYDRLVAQGRVSLDAALGAGRTIETTDIADLATAADGVSAADVTTVYQRLSAASQMHLRAFGG